MDRTERFYKIERLIRQRGCVSFATLREELDVSPATLKRDLQYLRDRLNAPIDYDRFSNGYRFGAGWRGEATSHQLPGVWFNEKELHALLTMHQLLAGLDDADGVLTRHLQPLQERLAAMLGSDEHEARELMKRVKLIGTARRRVPSRFFETVGSALTQRQRLALRYRKRSDRSVSERTVSPQRLVHYRNTWYLDAWCHKSDGLRRFALDAMEEAQALPERAKAVPLAQLESELDQGYGIFGGGSGAADGAAAGGRAVQWATLLFDIDTAQWVSSEEWHPAQRGRWLDDGRYELVLPFADPTELLMDVLRHAGSVEVRAPASLTRAFAQRLAKAAKRAAGATADRET